MKKHLGFLLIVILLVIGILLTRGAKFAWGPTKTPITPIVTQSPSPSTTLANPASVNCGKVGGKLFIQKDGTGNEYGLCDFGDNMQCEEWALYRGDCPVGGRKTTGFDTIQQKYCAWLGGQTFAVPNATCKFNDGSSCSDIALYNGTCQKGQNK